MTIHHPARFLRVTLQQQQWQHHHWQQQKQWHAYSCYLLELFSAGIHVVDSKNCSLSLQGLVLWADGPRILSEDKLRLKRAVVG